MGPYLKVQDNMGPYKIMQEKAGLKGPNRSKRDQMGPYRTVRDQKGQKGLNRIILKHDRL